MSFEQYVLKEFKGSDNIVIFVRNLKDPSKIIIRQIPRLSEMTNEIDRSSLNTLNGAVLII